MEISRDTCILLESTFDEEGFDDMHDTVFKCLTWEFTFNDDITMINYISFLYFYVY